MPVDPLEVGFLPPSLMRGQGNFRANAERMFRELQNEVNKIRRQYVPGGGELVGDLLSENWESGGGTVPLALSSLDTGATVGFGFDASEGAAQIMGDLFLGGDLVFKRNSTARISTNHSPQSGDVWIEYRGNDAGAIIGLRKVGSSELVAGQIGVTANGFEVETGQFLLGDGSQALPALTFGLDTDTGMYRSASGVISFTGNNNKIFEINTEGRVRIRSNTSGAGIWLQDTGDTDETFFGITTAADAGQLGFYLSSGWRLYINTDGPHIPSGHYLTFDGGSGTKFAESWGLNFRYGASSAQTLGSETSIVSGTTSSGGTNFGTGKFVSYNGSNRPQFTLSSHSTSGIGIPANNYVEIWGNGSVLAYFGNSDFGFGACGTTTNSGLPAYRSGASSTTSIHRLTSSARYKKYISRSDFDELEPIFDKIEVKRWKEKKSVVPHPSEDWIHGVIAEEVYEYAPQYVATDEDGAPSAVDPANAFILPTIAKVKRLEKRIAQLEALVN